MNEHNSPRESKDRSEVTKHLPAFVLSDYEKSLREKAERALSEIPLPGKKDGSNGEGEAFPVDIFPKAIREIITATNESLSFPVDFISSSLLYAASVAIGNTHRLKVKEGWEEGAVIYIALVGRPGIAKSHPLSFALAPIVERDIASYSEYEQRKKEYERFLKQSKNERELQNQDEPSKPVWQKFLLSDFTPEALADIHRFNKRGIGVYVDELAGWFKNFNRYNKGSEMEFWLSLWSGKPINIDRKTGEPVFIPMPFISVGGTIQTALLSELAKDNRNQNGFIDRILFVIPEGIKKPYWSDTDLSPEVKESWKGILTELLNIRIAYDDTTNNPIPERLIFTTEAKQILVNWVNSNTEKINNAYSDALSGIYSKLEIYVYRFSLILQLLRYACREGGRVAVDQDAARGAIRLVEYFRSAAIKVNSIVSNSSPLDKYAADKQALYQSLPDKFTTETGLLIAEGFGVSERSFKYFLNEKELFTRVSRGEYEKRI